MNQNVQHVFLVGAKSLGAYGGYETFLNKLTEYHQYTPSIQYHVACKANGEGCMNESELDGVSDLRRREDGSVAEFVYHNARCFKIRVPNIGPAQAVFYDVAALRECCRYMEANRISNPIVYIMACRIGPFMGYFCRRIHALGGKVFLNPDGHEWKRAKWNRFIRKYWKVSERMMVCQSDLIVCDSVNIENYIHKSYDGKAANGTDPKTVYIAYGAETEDVGAADENPSLDAWLSKNSLQSGEYYLIVGRFVPENNYETMIREFMRSGTKRPLVIITNTNDTFLARLEQRIHFSADSRIRFAGAVYDQALLAGIRRNARGYLHGHEVGGTNPSLLESLAHTKLNLLLDVCFNREVGQDAAMYWNKDIGSLSALIDFCDSMSEEAVAAYGCRAKKQIEQRYSWQYIANRYREIFCTGVSGSQE